MNKLIYTHLKPASLKNTHERINAERSNHLDPLARIRPQHLHQLLETESHIFIVFLGSVLGAIIALAIGYSIPFSIPIYLALSLIPLIMSYILREVYVYTLIHFRD